MEKDCILHQDHSLLLSDGSSLASVAYPLRPLPSYEIHTHINRKVSKRQSATNSLGVYRTAVPCRKRVANRLPRPHSCGVVEADLQLYRPLYRGRWGTLSQHFEC